MISMRNHPQASDFSERRKLHFSQLVPQQSFNQEKNQHEYKPEHKNVHDVFVGTPELQGAKEVFHNFAEKGRITSADLRAYITEREAGGNLSPYETKMKERFAKLDAAAGNTAEIVAAQKDIEDLVQYINSRNVVLRQQKMQLRNFEVKGSEVPHYTMKTLEYGKSFLSEGWNRFNRASGQEKGVILAGMTIASIMLGFFVHKSGKGGKIMKALGITLGIAMTAAAAETMWKAGSKMSESKDEWDAEKKRQEIDEISAILKNTQVPDDFLKSLDGNEQKVALPVANIASMSVEEFTAMYDVARSSKSIEDMNPLYPRRPVRKDGLLPAERFKVVEDIAKAVSIIDANGDFVELPKEREGKSMLYLILDWKNKEKKQEPPPMDMSNDMSGFISI